MPPKGRACRKRRKRTRRSDACPVPLPIDVFTQSSAPFYRQVRLREPEGESSQDYTSRSSPAHSTQGTRDRRATKQNPAASAHTGCSTSDRRSRDPNTTWFRRITATFSRTMTAGLLENAALAATDLSDASLLGAGGHRLPRCRELQSQLRNMLVALRRRLVRMFGAFLRFALSPLERRDLCPMRPARLSILVYCVALAACRSAEPPGSSSAIRAERAPSVSTHLLTGELVAERSVEITVPDVGIRPLEIRWMVENGATVAAGEPLFELDNSDLASRLEESRVACSKRARRSPPPSRSRAPRSPTPSFELERRRAELEKARIDAGIPRDLRSQEEYQRLQLELQKAKRRVADAERLLATARDTTGAADREAAPAARQAGGRAAPGRGRHRAPRGRAPERRRGAGRAQLGTGPPIRAGRRGLPGPSARRAPRSLDRWWRGPACSTSTTAASRPACAPRSSSTRTPASVRGRRALGRPHRLPARPRLERARVLGHGRSRRRSTSSACGPACRSRSPSTAGSHRAAEAALVAPRESLDLSDLEAPRALLPDGSWRAVELSDCTPLDCVVTGGLAEGERARARSARRRTRDGATRGARSGGSSASLLVAALAAVARVRAEPARGRASSLESRSDRSTRWFRSPAASARSQVAQYGPPQLAQVWEYRITFSRAKGVRSPPATPVIAFDTTELEQSLRRHSDRPRRRRQRYERRRARLRRRAVRAAARARGGEGGRSAGRRSAPTVPSELVARSTLEKAEVDLELARTELDHRTERIADLGRRSNDRARGPARPPRSRRRGGGGHRAIDRADDRSRHQPRHREPSRRPSRQQEEGGRELLAGRACPRDPGARSAADRCLGREADSGGCGSGSRRRLWLEAHADRSFPSRSRTSSRPSSVAPSSTPGRSSDSSSRIAAAGRAAASPGYAGTGQDRARAPASAARGQHRRRVLRAGGTGGAQ